MLLIEMLMIFFGIVFSLYSIYTDIKYKIIKNQIILFLISFAILGHTYLFLNGVEQLTMIILVISESLVIMFFLFYFNLISSGDAKLFWALSSILPLSFYANPRILYFPIEILLFNTFLTLLIFLVGYIVINTKIKTKTLKKLINPFEIFLNAISFLILSILVRNILSPLIISQIFLFTVLFTISLKEWLDRQKTKFKFFVYIIASLFSFVLFIKDVSTYLILTGVTLLVYTVFRCIFLAGQDVFNKKIKINNIKVGMIVTERIVYRNKKYIKEPLHLLKSETLTQKDINRIKRLYNSNKLDFDTISTIKTMLLSPFIFLGFLLTIGRVL